MHLLYFYQHFSTSEGSTGIRAYEFAKELVNRGHKVTLICGRCDASKTGLENIPFTNGKRKGRVDGIDVIELFLPYSNKMNFLTRTVMFLKYALRSIAIAMSKNYDLAFATSTPLTAGIPGIFAKWIRKKTFIFEVRDLWPELPKAMGVIKNPFVLKAMSILESITYHSADALIGLSPGIVDGIIKKGISEKIVSLIPNGCDSGIFKPVFNKKKDIDVINDSDFVAIFTGTHGIANGLDAVLDTAEVLIKKDRNNIKLLFIGNGKLKPHLLERAKEEKLYNCIFLDSVPKTKVAGITANCDAGLMVLANVPAFYYGTSPNKFFDYISCGLPVINNYPGWLADMIMENHCGIVVTPDDPEAFANALIYMSENRVEAEKMGKNSFRLADKFKRSVLAQQFATLIENTAKNRSKTDERNDR